MRLPCRWGAITVGLLVLGGIALNADAFQTPASDEPILEGVDYLYDSAWGDNYDTWGPQNAFDGSFDTTFHSDPGSGWVGLDLGEPRLIGGLGFAPRDPWENEQMEGGYFEAADNPDFEDAVTLYTIDYVPEERTLHTRSFDTVEYQYVRYYSPGGHGTITILEFYEPDIVETPPALSATVEPGGSAELGPVLLHEEFDGQATFQWYFEGDPIEGETDDGLLLDDVTEDDVGTYTVVVSHPDFETTLAEYDISVGLFEATPAAGLAGLAAAGGAIALIGLARIRRKRQ